MTTNAMQPTCASDLKALAIALPLLALALLSGVSLDRVDTGFVVSVIPEILTIAFLALLTQSMSLSALLTSDREDIDTSREIAAMGQGGADLSYDFITRPAYHHALVTGDGGLVFFPKLGDHVHEGGIPLSDVHALLGLGLLYLRIRIVLLVGDLEHHVDGIHRGALSGAEGLDIAGPCSTVP